MPGAVFPFERLVKRNTPKPTDRLFPSLYSHFFDRVLKEEGLKFDRLGQRRTAYSLRHTYISFRLMEGADIYQVAKNCRTSVEMIEKYYASHIKNRLDTVAINVVKARPKKNAVAVVVGPDGTLPTPKEKISLGNKRMQGKVLLPKTSGVPAEQAAKGAARFKKRRRAGPPVFTRLD